MYVHVNLAQDSIHKELYSVSIRAILQGNMTGILLIALI